MNNGQSSSFVWDLSIEYNAPYKISDAYQKVNELPSGGSTEGNHRSVMLCDELAGRVEEAEIRIKNKGSMRRHPEWSIDLRRKTMRVARGLYDTVILLI
jgi:hypothetical protein